MNRIFLFILFPLFTFSQKTFIPDDAFEQALINLEVDDVFDDSVFTSAIDTIKLLDIYNKGIVTLEGIKDFASLTDLFCFNNQLTSLDLSNHPNLFEVNCSNNQLNELTIKNGNSNGLWFFNATNNPDLSCVEVDNVSYAYNNWVSGLPVMASFSTNCNPSSVNEIRLQPKLIKIVDFFGRETSIKTNQPLLYIFDDGSVEKRINVE